MHEEKPLKVFAHQVRETPVLEENISIGRRPKDYNNGGVGINIYPSL